EPGLYTAAKSADEARGSGGRSPVQIKDETQFMGKLHGRPDQEIDRAVVGKIRGPGRQLIIHRLIAPDQKRHRRRNAAGMHCGQYSRTISRPAFREEDGEMIELHVTLAIDSARCALLLKVFQIETDKSLRIIDNFNRTFLLGPTNVLP